MKFLNGTSHSRLAWLWLGTPAAMFLLCANIGFGPLSAEARLGMGAQALTGDTFQAFIEKNGKLLVDFFDPQDPKWREGQSELEAAIRRVRDVGCKVPFAKVDVVKESALAAKFVPEGHYPQLMWFLHGEPTKYHRTLRTSKSIGDFVLALDRDPIVLVKNEAGARDFVPAVFARARRGSPMYRTLEIVASKHMDAVAFAVLEGADGQVSWLGNDTAPVKYEGDFQVPVLDHWVRQQLVKSEPIPENPALLEESGSKIVVGKSFEDIVLQKDKDVILQVYAPWCGFCKKFAPTWDAFAQELARVQHLVVAKMDGSRNGSPLPEDFSWESYPKIFMVKAGARKPIHFEGNRTFENLIEFAGKHSSKPLQVEKASGRGGSVESVMDL